MRRWIALLLVCAGCNSSTPTAPSPPPVTAPPVVTTPAPTTPTAPPPAPPRLPLSDPRFDLAFYRQFAHDALENQSLVTLRRQTQAPRIYLRTIHDNGTTIDAFTLNETAAALENTAGLLTGVFGLAGIERGTGSRRGEQGWITVYWADDPARRYCGYGLYAGDALWLYTNTANCRCSGGPAVRLRTVKHELGHVLGYYHTDSETDLMFSGGRQCDMEPSAREVFHAAVAYSMPIGSLPQ